MPWCTPCDRYFNDLHGYNQHVNNSSAHNNYESSSSEEELWECLGCDGVFGSENARKLHMRSSHNTRYCVPCDRLFKNQNNLTQHQHSKTHVGTSMECPFCKNTYTTASGLTIHLESGTCTSGLNRQKINDAVRQMDRHHVITRPMIQMPGYSNTKTYATEHAWNGSGFQCYLCNKTFNLLHGLNNHLQSPVHEQSMYRCPKASCGKQFKLLSGLVQHVESESCGVMRFDTVQNQAKTGLQNMVGRMITG